VRVVEEQHDVLALLQAADQELVELVQQGPFAGFRGADPQLARQLLEQHVIPVMGGLNQDGPRPLVETVHGLPDKLRLAHAPAAEDDDVALSLPDTVEDGGQRLPVRLGREERLAVPVLPEGHPAQAVELRVIHLGRSACSTKKGIGPANPLPH